MIFTDENGKKYRIEEIKEDVKVAFVIGHYENEKGAVSENLSINEFDMWDMFYEMWLHDLGDCFFHPKINSYTERQKETAKKTATYDIVFELHFNSSDNPQANGAECLVYFSNKKTYDVGSYFCDQMQKKLGIKNRGAKKITGGNGYGFLKETKGDAILLEPFFGSNEKDCNLFEMKKYADVIKDTINYYKSLS